MALSLEDVRRRYAPALQASNLAADLLADLEEDSPEPIILAYQAATQALLARQTGNPFQKLDYVSNRKIPSAEHLRQTRKMWRYVICGFPFSTTCPLSWA
jgi:hypothetical protein